MEKNNANKFREFIAYSVIGVAFIVFLIVAASFSWWAWSTAMGWR